MQIDRSKRSLLGWLALCLSTAPAVFSVDWPQYRGPNHDGTSPERIRTQWPTGGPRQLWKKSLPDGWGSFAISQGKAYTSVKRFVNGERQEVVLALNADSGDETWARPIGTPVPEDSRDGRGPRSTPTVEGDRVYALSTYFGLFCLNARDGSIVWQRDMLQEFGGRGPDFDAAASPLLHGDLLLVNGPMDGTGEKLFGIDKHDGRTVWVGPSAKLTHSTPIATTLHGIRQVLFFTKKGAVAIAPDTGKELWRYAFDVGIPVTMSPLLGGDILYHSAGYGAGARAARITKSGDTFQVKELWQKRGQLVNFLSTPVYYEGHIYGMYGDKKYGIGPLECYELATGELKWSQPNFGVGQVLLVDGHLLALSDTGSLVLVKATSQSYTEIARAKVLKGTCWNSPAISNGRLYARSTQEGVCLDVSLPTPPRARLSLPERPLEGGFKMTLANADGTTIDSNRMANIAVLTSSNLSLPVTNWTRLERIPTLVNGQWLVQDDTAGADSARYYLLTETP